ncbi:transposable element Tcb2 transposase [Trichonephila clavipes]|nr:transposable element Tcb2 transposase [Trichonephila clavipes]
MWNVTDWQKVVFSDESRFVLRTDDNRVWMWRCPAYDSRSTLIVMRETLTNQRYVDDILRPHTFPWPARSPDLSPVELVWDQLKRQMPSCLSVHDLELAVQDLGAHLPQDNIRIKVIELQKSKESIVLQWIPYYCNISGNEKADRLAKAGPLMSQPDSPLPLRNIKTHLQ